MREWGPLLTVGFRLAGLLLVVAATPRTTTETSTVNFRKPDAPAASHAPQVIDSYGKLPLHFEPNVGQFDPRVRYAARAGGYTLFLTDTESVIVLSRREKRESEGHPHELPVATKVERAVVRMKLVGSSKPAEWAALERLPGITNYFIGDDPENWHTNIQTYRKVEVNGVYPGIDLMYYGNQGRLEYDLVVKPGADADQVQLAWEGIESLELDSEGNLVLETRLGKVVQKRPRVYQEISGERVEVGSGYRVTAGNRVSFELAGYDRSKPLLIDPVVLAYSTYLSGSDPGDESSGIAVDETGAAYVTGFTFSSDYPTQSPYQTDQGDGDVFVTKLTPDGNALAYSTYLGGSSLDAGNGITVDETGAAYVTGYTESTDFPTQSPYQTHQGGGDVFVTKLTPDGNALAYSTYLGGGGRDSGNGIAVGETGAAYVTGRTDSTGFPTRSPYQTYQGSGDVFVTKLTPDGNALAYSTYLGGNVSGVPWGGASESGHDIAVDGAGSAYVTGSTESTDFPTESQILAHQGAIDVFVTKLMPAGNALAYSTYLGGSSNDAGNSIAVDETGAAYVTGPTWSSDYPTQSPYQKYQGFGDAFVTKLTPAGNALAYSTCLGGSSSDSGDSIAVDETGAAYVTGSTGSADFPTESHFLTHQGFGDVFVTKLMPAGSALAYSTYLGGSSAEVGDGIAVDETGAAYVTGYTESTDFPTQSPYQTHQGGRDVFVTKLTHDVPAPAFSPAGVVNAASYAGGAVAPSEIITIFGTGLGPADLATMELTPDGQYVSTSLAGVRVLFDDIAAPLIYVSSDKVSAVVPTAIAGKPTTQMQIEYLGTLSDPVVMSVFSVIPGIFTLDASGSGQGAFLHWPDYSVNGPGNPATRGSVMMVFATSGGLTQPPSEDGRVVTQVQPLQIPVTATIGGVPATVTYAGGAPNLVTGVLQVNIEIPPNAPTGDSVPLIITVGGAPSQQGVTVAIQ